MPRLPRIHVETAVYYVAAKGSQHQDIFKEKADYTMYLELLTKYKSQHKFKLYSYCLLPDRLSLLIETGDDATISQIMHDLNSLYTKYFNGRYNRRGHLFESRFRSVLVEKAMYLLQMSRFVHQMPGSAFPEYPYHSYQVYTLGQNPAGPALDEEVREVLSFLKDKDDKKAYERYCLQGDKKEIEDLEKCLKRGSVLGSEAFVKQVRSRIQQHVEQREAAAVKQTAAVKPSRTVVVAIGAFILLATSSSVYLYISKVSLENKYAALLEKKEAEFSEKIKFQNLNPLSLSELEGTEWEIDMVPVSGAKEAPIRDRVIFRNGKVYSTYLAAKGFLPTNYSLSDQGSGLTSWETIQSNPNGDSANWRGDWKGDAMKGVLSFRPAGQSPRDFSFFSVGWSYLKAAGATQ